MGQCSPLSLVVKFECESGEKGDDFRRRRNVDFRSDDGILNSLMMRRL